MSDYQPRRSRPAAAANDGAWRALHDRRASRARAFLAGGGVTLWPEESRPAVLAWARADERRAFRHLPGSRFMLCGGERHYQLAQACLEAAGMPPSPEVAACLAAQAANVTPDQALAFARALRDHVPSGESLTERYEPRGEAITTPTDSQVDTAPDRHVAGPVSPHPDLDLDPLPF